MLKFRNYLDFSTYLGYNCVKDKNLINLKKGETTMASQEPIKYEGDNTTFIWKHPKEDFNTATQLIVHESQEAVLFMNGQALDLFGAGRHSLETQNIPIPGKRLFGKILGSPKTFHCEVYFINKSVQMALKWGTDSKIRFLEPTYGIPVELGASGEMNLAVSDSRKLLVKLVGTTKGIAWESDTAGFTKSLQACFRPLISTAVKSHLPTVIKNLGINILEIDQHLAELSESLCYYVKEGFEEYGLTIPQLYITNVTLPEEDPNFQRLKQLRTVAMQTEMARADAAVKSAEAEAEADIVAAKRRAELERQTTETEIARREAERSIIRAQAEAEAAKITGYAEADVMSAKGYTQRDVFNVEVQKAYAEGIGNMQGGGGSVVGDFVSLGVGMAAAEQIGSRVGDSVRSVAGEPKEKTVKCAACGAEISEKNKFCPECGERVVPDSSIVCPECGNVVAKGKFCPECGHKFVTACPACGASINPGTKFCPECGEKL